MFVIDKNSNVSRFCEIFRVSNANCCRQHETRVQFDRTTWQSRDRGRATEYTTELLVDLGEVGKTDESRAKVFLIGRGRRENAFRPTASDTRVRTVAKVIAVGQNLGSWRLRVWRRRRRIVRTRTFTHKRAKRTGTSPVTSVRAYKYRFARV